MANSIKILELLKWYTDEEHPITQERLRAKPGADKYMGYKTTFKRRLMDIATLLNGTSQSEKDWRVVFPGYAQDNSSDPNARHYTGPMYYRHEIKKQELDFILDQLQATNQFTLQEKQDLSDRLVRLLGSVHYQHTAYHSIKDMLEISPCDSDTLIANLNFLRDAITNQKMITFEATRLDENGNYRRIDEPTHMVSPYRIVFHKNAYWLLCNERLGKTSTQGYSFIKYSKSIDIYRVDKMKNLKIAQESLEKKAKYFWGTLEILRTLEKILCYKDGQKIIYSDITEDYGRVEFEILWESFPQRQRGDCSFIQDTFGENYNISKTGSQTIVSVQCTEDFFVDWVLGYVDKVRIIDSSPSAHVLKKRIRQILEKGMTNL